MIKKLIATLFVSLLFLSGCNKNTTDTLRYVEYLKVKKEIPVNEKEFFGFIKAGGEVALSFQTPGQITTINFTDGDRVKKGDVIAKIDNELSVLDERERQIRVEDARVKYENARSYYERMDKLHTVGAISDKDWEAARTNMESYRNQIQIAQEALASAGKITGFGTLYAPGDGIILRKIMEVNQYAQAGQGVVIFQDDRNTEAKIFVSEKYINDISTGDSVDVKIPDIDKGFKKAVIANMTKTSIDQGAYKVTLRFKEKYHNLKDGMAISAYIRLQTPPIPMIMIPVNSVLEDENSSYVWLIENIENGKGEIRRKDIITGNMINNLIVVNEGLKEGDLIVKRGMDEIMDGQKVLIRQSE